MPKIRLSTIASDIKGKSNGSVFSRNNGGLYFRNNPSGGGRKTSKWDIAKSQLASVTSRWKKLTDSQRESWESATSNFPINDAFGQPRNQSGYELFTRLNTVRRSMGLDILKIAPNNDGIVGIRNAVLSTPDDLLLIPENELKLYGAPSQETECEFACRNITCEPDFICDCGDCVQPWEGGIAVNSMYDNTSQTDGTLSVLIDALIPQWDEIDTKYFILGFQADDPNGTQIYLVKTGDQEAKLVFDYFSADINYKNESDPFELKPGTRSRYTVKWKANSSAADFVLEMRKDREVLNLGSFTSDPGSPGKVADPIIGSNNGGEWLKGSITDFRYFTKDLNDAEMEKVSYGYEVGSEATWLLMDKIVGSDIPNYGSDNATVTATLQGTHSWSYSLDVNRFNIYPQITFTFGTGCTTSADCLEGETCYDGKCVPECTVDSETFVKVLLTPPKSDGRNGATNNVKSMGYFKACGVHTIDISDGFYENFGNVVDNAVVSAFYEDANATTGSKSERKICGNKVKFKAGAELSGKVK